MLRGGIGLVAVWHMVPVLRQEHDNVNKIVMSFHVIISQKHRTAMLAIV